MAGLSAAFIVIAASFLTGASSASVSPVQKVISLLGSLELKIINDGQEEKKAFEAFMDWCRNGAKDKEFEIKTAKSSIADLKATIEKADSDIVTMGSKIQDLAGALSQNDGDLKAATGIRAKENGEFATTETELVDAIDTLERAINILERKLRGSTLLQAKVDKKDIRELVRVLSTVIDAAAMNLHDKQKLLGLVQSKEAEEEEEDEDEDAMALGAPQAEAYESHSESIVDVLENLKQKAVAQLDEARREEQNARHNFELLKQSIEDQMKVDNKEMTDAKQTKHDATGTKATSSGDLTVTTKDLEDAENVLKNMAGDCQQKAADHEVSAKNRAEELKALAAAKKAIMEMTGSATVLAYNTSMSFLQLEGSGRHSQTELHTRVDLVNFEVVNLVRKLAREQKSTELAQLAQRISAAENSASAGGEDPFAKVKGMISEMISRLTQDAGAEAEHKAYCDKEFGETKTKIDQLKYDTEKYSSKIDKARADSATLKDEVSVLHKEIAEITKVQTSADALRKEEHKVYVESAANLKQGLAGVRTALKLLRDYYASEGAASLVQQPDAPELHSKASGAGTGVIGMLEVVESDFGKSLASTEVNEEGSANSYEKLAMENRMSMAMKSKDVEYKSKEAASLDKSSQELDSDRNSAQTELDAVLQYSSKIRDMCVLKPESYEERAGRRTAEIAGLREALQILEGESVFVQKQQRGQRRSLRSHKA